MCQHDFIDHIKYNALRVARKILWHISPYVTYRHHVHVWVKIVAVRMTYLIISSFPFSYVIRRLDYSRTITSTSRSGLLLPCRTVADPKARSKRTSARAARSFATWSIQRTPQIRSPKSSTRLLLQTETRRLSTIRNTITSLTSQKSYARTLNCSVSTIFLKSLFRTFLMKEA